MDFQFVLANLWSIVAGLALACYLGYRVYQFVSLPKTSDPAVQQARIKSLIRDGVMAVEQTCSLMVGPDKKREAVKVISQLLSNEGLNVSPVLLDTLIESAVLVLNQGKDPSQVTAVQPAVKP